VLVSIIMPIHNQADHIGRIVEGYVNILPQFVQDYELIVVANACTDNSVAVCKELANHNSKIKILETPQSGWGKAVKLGLSTVQGDIVCYTNSARTTPEVLRSVLEYSLINPNVVVKANRKIRDGLRRRLGSLLYNLECRMLFDSPVWDINGTPKVFPRKYTPLLNLSREDDLIDAEFVALCRKYDYPMLEVPVLSTKRHGGKSTTNYGSAVKMYIGALRLWQQFKKTSPA
jgi:glycosyltransferase involved in cell wall biosynthesis